VCIRTIKIVVVRVTDVENKVMTNRGVGGKEGGGGINWETGIDVYTLLYIRLEKEMANHSSILAWKIL